MIDETAKLLAWLDHVETVSRRLLANPVTDERGAREIIETVRVAGRELRAVVMEARSAAAPSDALTARLHAAGEVFEVASVKLIPLARRHLS